jgi:hypothetical protein
MGTRNPILIPGPRRGVRRYVPAARHAGRWTSLGLEPLLLERFERALALGEQHQRQEKFAHLRLI